jgi:hypothetical protein
VSPIEVTGQEKPTENTENAEKTFTAENAENAENCFLTAENAENTEFFGGHSSRDAPLDPRG